MDRASWGWLDSLPIKIIFFPVRFEIAYLLNEGLTFELRCIRLELTFERFGLKNEKKEFLMQFLFSYLIYILSYKIVFCKVNNTDCRTIFLSTQTHQPKKSSLYQIKLVYFIQSHSRCGCLLIFSDSSNSHRYFLPPKEIICNIVAFFLFNICLNLCCHDPILVCGYFCYCIIYCLEGVAFFFHIHNGITYSSYIIYNY